MANRYGMQGIDEFLRYVNDVQNAVEEQTKIEVEKTAYKIEREAKQLAPVDTGNLRRNIMTKVEDGGMSATVSSNAEYSLYVEYGTMKQAAQPYMTPAIQNNRDTFYRNLERLARKAGG